MKWNYSAYLIFHGKRLVLITFYGMHFFVEEPRLNNMSTQGGKSIISKTKETVTFSLVPIKWIEENNVSKVSGTKYFLFGRQNLFSHLFSDITSIGYKITCCLYIYFHLETNFTYNLSLRYSLITFCSYIYKVRVHILTVFYWHRAVCEFFTSSL